MDPNSSPEVSPSPTSPESPSPSDEKAKAKRKSMVQRLKDFTSKESPSKEHPAEPSPDQAEPRLSDEYVKVERSLSNTAQPTLVIDPPTNGDPAPLPDSERPPTPKTETSETSEDPEESSRSRTSSFGLSRKGTLRAVQRIFKENLFASSRGRNDDGFSSQTPSPVTPISGESSDGSSNPASPRTEVSSPEPSGEENRLSVPSAEKRSLKTLRQLKRSSNTPEKSSSPPLATQDAFQKSASLPKGGLNRNASLRILKDTFTYSGNRKSLIIADILNGKDELPADSPERTGSPPMDLVQFLTSETEPFPVEEKSSSLKRGFSISRSFSRSSRLSQAALDEREREKERLKEKKKEKDKEKGEKLDKGKEKEREREREKDKEKKEKSKDRRRSKFEGYNTISGSSNFTRQALKVPFDGEHDDKKNPSLSTLASSPERVYEFPLLHNFPPELNPHEPGITKEESKRRKRVQATAFIVEELCHTEKNYVDTLNAVVEVFVKPLRTAIETKHPILNSADLKVMFSPIEEIAVVNTDFLKDLTEIAKTWDFKESRVGGVFQKHFTSCEAYAKFVDNYSLAKAALRRNEERSAAYRNFVQERLSLPENRRQNLSDHFILPIQRVTRYTMLLNDLLKHTDSDHVDYQSLEQSCRLMKDLASKINEVKRKEETFTKLFEIQKEVEGCPPTIVSAHRKYVTDLNFLEFDPATHTPLPAAHLFLFSDVLLISKYPTVNWVSKLGSKNSSKFHKLLELKQLTVSPLDDVEEKNLRFLFKITTTDKNPQQYCFQAAYANQRQEFIDAILQNSEKKKKDHERKDSVEKIERKDLAEKRKETERRGSVEKFKDEAQLVV